MGRIVLVALAAALGCAALLLGADSHEGDGATTFLEPSEAAPPPKRTGPTAGLAPSGRKPEPRVLEATVLARDPEAAARRRQLEALWERALVLHAMERDPQALALLKNVLAQEPAFFAEPGRAKQLAEIRAGARRIREVVEGGETLEDLVKELQRWGNLRPPNDPDAATALEKQLRHAAEQIAQLRDAKQRERLMQHLRRFLLPAGTVGSRGRRGKFDVDGMLRSVRKRESGRKAPTVPLALDDPEEIEKRRMEQLELLRQRGALTLLDSLHAGLAFLALYQAPDGRFSDAAALERAAVLYPDDPKAQKSARRGLRGADRYALSTTALALMAFLDFRDQDGQGLFEPTIARATAWLRGQQVESGLFKSVGRHYYSDAIALMALAQVAWSTGDEAVRKSVERGLAALHELRGPLGGYRYRKGQAGDLSVTGWVVQAVEYAELAGAKIPDGMKAELEEFLEAIWTGKERFQYIVDRRTEWGRPSLWPVGMLCGRVLFEEVGAADRASWSRWLREPAALGRRGPQLYTLYYAVRMDVWLHQKLTPRWHGWLHELAKKQVPSGPLAGAFPSDVDRWLRQAGSTLPTALALLSMEHALFLR